MDEASVKQCSVCGCNDDHERAIEGKARLLILFAAISGMEESELPFDLEELTAAQTAAKRLIRCDLEETTSENYGRELSETIKRCEAILQDAYLSSLTEALNCWATYHCHSRNQ